MAQNDGERRMLFDIRGRRKNVVKVVYATLALLMGASLFLVVGPGGIADIFGTGSTTSSEAAEQYEDQAAKIERQLRKSPEDPALLLALTRQRIYAGNALSQANPETGETLLTFDSRPQLERASAAWSKYLKATDEPSPGGAQLTAPALFSLASTATTPAEIQSNLNAAAAAQQILADARPSLGSLSTLAIYRYFNFDYDEASKAGKQAQTYATSKFERESLENRLEEVEKQAREFQKQLTEFNKANEGRGKEGLENPFGGLGAAPVSP